MEPQNYSNHRKYVPLFHMILFPALVLTLGGASVNLYQSIGDHQRLYGASLILVLVLCTIGIFFLCRIFALKAQDRAIKAEENLRHYLLAGKLLDGRLTVRQIVGLRFASDDEFVELARKAAEQNISEDDIKKSIRNWRADHYRV